MTGKLTSALDKVHYGDLLATTTRAKNKLDQQSPDQNWGLGVAKVVGIDYEEFHVTLRTLIGTDDVFNRVPVPLTFPGAGTRHFFGAMPQVGDHCVVGWMPQESADPKGTRTPVILGWIIPGVNTGREWLTTAGFEDHEHDYGSSQGREVVRGSYDRIRHKLRHLQPGNVLASSSQGSDMVLDEGVLLSNRRGNEFRLRDQDQAAVLRALQRFDALAGARVYAGMVQRDASFLATSTVSDGFEWDGKVQSVSGEPIGDDELPADTALPEGFLTPARQLLRGQKSDADGGGLGRSFLPIDRHLDPYEFLSRGGFIDSSGFVVDDKHQADAVYGGKPIYRVASQSKVNAVTDADRPTLVEHRIEVAHTTDGRLPVTEQTDMFDADRLPSGTPNANRGFPPNTPFIEWVMGSVVGNDFYSQNGRRRYGVPLKATIFDGDIPNPRIDAVRLVSDEDSGESPEPLARHAATLFKLSPPLPGGGAGDTFWSVNKQGQVSMAVGGPPRENSVEAFFKGGLKLGVGGRFQLLLNGHIDLKTKSKSSMNLAAEEGQLHLYGGGPPKDGAATTARISPGGRGEGGLPSVFMEARTNALIKAGQQVKITGQEVEINTPSAKIIGNQEVTIEAVKRMALQTESLQKTISGKAQDSYSGPKNSKTTNGPLHERSYSPSIPGVTCEEVTYNLGGRVECFQAGDHETTILVGDMTWQTNTGKWKVRANTAQMEMGQDGISGTASTGDVSFNATAGTATLAGLSGVTIKADAGDATVKGATSVKLLAPIVGTDQGAIICEGSREPFTNLPFSTWGLGAKRHVVGA